MKLLQKLIFSSKDLSRHYTTWGPKVKLLRRTFHEALSYLSANQHPRPAPCQQVPSPSYKPPMTRSNQAISSPSSHGQESAFITVLVIHASPRSTANAVRVDIRPIYLRIPRSSNYRSASLRATCGMMLYELLSTRQDRGGQAKPSTHARVLGHPVSKDVLNVIRVGGA